MSAHLHQMVVNASIESVWKFVYSVANWAPLIPGYIEHEMLNERESTWKFKSDLGIIKKKIHVKVEMTSWIEQEKITFNLHGINERFNGYGYIETKAITEYKTQITGFLDITAQGHLAKVLKPIIRTNIPEITEEFTIFVNEKIEEIAGSN